VIGWPSAGARRGQLHVRRGGEAEAGRTSISLRYSLGEHGFRSTLAVWPIPADHCAMFGASTKGNNAEVEF
jgi:hypothetical protein